jgi:Mu transposase, C-terminal
LTVESKGTVEALFTWVTRKFTHRLPGTTKSTPADRGTYDSRGEAEKAGITLDVLEKWFIQAIVDAYMQEWDRERRGRRTSLWEESVQKMGVSRYLGSPDDLKLLLMKALNRKNPATGRYAISPYRGLSFLGYRYVSPGLLDRLRGREIDIDYDRRDIAVIYLFEEGALRGEAYCTELLGERLSVWEAQARRKSDTAQAKEASMMSLEARQRIQQEAGAGKKALALETRRLEKQRQLDQQRADMHPEPVQTALHILAHQQEVSPVPASTPTGLLPPAIPEDEAETAPVVHLQIRKRRSHDD